MKSYDPELFLIRKEGLYDAYSRVCQPTSRQPVILTDEEKNKIDRENRGAYSNAIRYGSNPDKKFWYICPRFWCMKTNSPLTEQQVNDGVCKDNYFQFTNKKHYDEEGKYVTHNPSLILNAHPTSGVPCCFKKSWDSEQLEKQRQAYSIGPEDISHPDDYKEPEDKKKVGIKENEPASHYIMGFDKYPVTKNRWGFLPPSVQSFFQIQYTNDITKKNPAIIQTGKKTLLRYGVEQSKTQSFIGCIASIYAWVNESVKEVPTIKEMRTILIEAISLDHYIQYHNGSFVNLFLPSRKNKEHKKFARQPLSEEIIQKYALSEFYQKIDINNEAQHDFLEDTIASFEHFKEFLSDDNAVIDHTYLWDVVITPNNHLFPAGLNLVLLEIQETDVTEHVELICPSNSYMNKLYDPLKETAILLKHDEFYEPIYVYHSKSEGQTAEISNNATFDESTAPENIRRVLQLIQKTSGKYCRPLPSMPTTYTFKKNLSAVEIKYLLDTQSIPIQMQVRNYRGKTIGLLVKEKYFNASGGDDTKNMFLPCYPSPNLPKIPLQFMDVVVWSDYKTTIDFLKEIKQDVPKLLCSPLLKVVDSGLIVGLFTETNQFIQIDPAIPDDVEDGLDVFQAVGFRNNGYFQAEKTLMVDQKQDEVRISAIRNIFLETQFYATFRTTARILLMEQENRHIREKITEILDIPYQMHSVQLKMVSYLLRDLLKDSVRFQDFPETLLNDLEDINTCVSNYDSKKYCLMENNEYQPVLLLPTQNLITPTVENKTHYFTRLADELIRYKRVRLFLLEPKHYLNITEMQYKVNEKEMILLQSLLDGTYFDDLVPFRTNEYMENIPYELAEPIITQKYDNKLDEYGDKKNKDKKKPKEVEVEVETEAEESSDSEESQESEDSEDSAEEEPEPDQDIEKVFDKCIEKRFNKINVAKTSVWKRIFPENAKEIQFLFSQDCTFSLMMYIYYKHTKKFISIKTLKETLVEKYNQVMEKHKDDILFLLGNQGKKQDMIHRVRTNRITLDALIKSEEYYLTNLDFWALSSILNLPILLFSTKNLKILGLEVDWVTLGGNPETDSYFFIRSPVKVDKKIPEHIPSLIEPAYPLRELKENFISKINNLDYVEHNLTFETYLDYFQRKNRNKTKK